jgi:hypothetical protein
MWLATPAHRQRIASEYRADRFLGDEDISGGALPDQWRVE